MRFQYVKILHGKNMCYLLIKKNQMNKERLSLGSLTYSFTGIIPTAEKAKHFNFVASYNILYVLHFNTILCLEY